MRIVGKGRKRGFGVIGVALRAGAAVTDAAAGIDRSLDLRQCAGIAIDDGSAQQGPGGSIAVLHRMDQRQGRLAFGKVVAQVFAQGGGIGGVVEHVVGDLERIAQGQAIAMQRVAGCGIGAGQHRPQAGGGGEQHCGLALDHAQVSGFVGVRVAHVEQLQHLALGNGVGGVGQEPHHFRTLQFHHQLEAARVQEIPDQHAGRVPPHRVGGAAAASQVGLVDHVVVQQGRGMDEFDHRRQLVRIRTDAPAGRLAQRAGRQQQQHRPQPLAAGADDVLGHLVDQHHVGGQPLADKHVHGRHLGRGQSLDCRQVEVPGRRCEGFGHGGGRCGVPDYRPQPALPCDAAFPDPLPGRIPVVTGGPL